VPERPQRLVKAVERGVGVECAEHPAMEPKMANKAATREEILKDW
jgi:hypothetical protein